MEGIHGSGKNLGKLENVPGEFSAGLVEVDDGAALPTKLELSLETYLQPGAFSALGPA
jgi:hypothetical protein